MMVRRECCGDDDAAAVGMVQRGHGSVNAAMVVFGDAVSEMLWRGGVNCCLQGCGGGEPATGMRQFLFCCDVAAGIRQCLFAGMLRQGCSNCCLGEGVDANAATGMRQWLFVRFQQ